MLSGDSVEKNLHLTSLEDGPVAIPAGISTLTTLTRLHLTLANHVEKHAAAVDLAQLYTLTNLQHLFVRSESASLCLSTAFSNLRSLKVLHFSAASMAEDFFGDVEHDLYLGLHVDWSGLYALQDLTFNNWHFTHVSGMSGLTTLQSLASVRFHNIGFEHSDDGEARSRCLAALAISLGRRCPHCTYYINA